MLTSLKSLMALLIKSPRKRIKQKEIEINYDNKKKCAVLNQSDKKQYYLKLRQSDNEIDMIIISYAHHTLV